MHFILAKNLKANSKFLCIFLFLFNSNKKALNVKKITKVIINNGLSLLKPVQLK